MQIKLKGKLISTKKILPLAYFFDDLVVETFFDFGALHFLYCPEAPKLCGTLTKQHSSSGKRQHNGNKKASCAKVRNSKNITNVNQTNWISWNSSNARFTTHKRTFLARAGDGVLHILLYRRDSPPRQPRRICCWYDWTRRVFICIRSEGRAIWEAIRPEANAMYRRSCGGNTTNWIQPKLTDSTLARETRIRIAKELC